MNFLADLVTEFLKDALGSGVLLAFLLVKFY